MKCFSTYLREYRKGGTAKRPEYQFALPVETPVVPETVKKNSDAANFFAGTSVYNEKIDTCSKKYYYEATFYASKECREDELKSLITEGLEELGCKSIEVCVNKVLNGMAKKTCQEFKVKIKTL